MKLLVTQALLLNGGDEALLRSALSAMQRRWPQCTITVRCHAADRSRALFPDLPIAGSDLEEAWQAPTTLAQRCCNRLEQWGQGLASTSWGLPWFRQIANRARQTVLADYEAADAIISAPGGFLHDEYDVQPRLRALATAQALGKPTAIFAQSVGPFWKPASQRLVRQVFNRLDAVCLRDYRSYEHLRECGVTSDRLFVTTDAAFLLLPLVATWLQQIPETNQRQHWNRQVGVPQRVGLIFRPWTHAGTQAALDLIPKATTFCNWLLEDPQRELIFLSTCQGLADYTDDAALAEKIVQQLPPTSQQRCRVIGNHLSIRELIQTYNSLDAMISMRLHGCLLALLAGVPALGLGYQPKTAEIYRQLGWEDFQLSFDLPVSRWKAATQRFFSLSDHLRASLPEQLNEMYDRASQTLQILEERLPGLARTTIAKPITNAALVPAEHVALIDAA